MELEWRPARSVGAPAIANMDFKRRSARSVGAALFAIMEKKRRPAKFAIAIPVRQARLHTKIAVYARLHTKSAI
jgi:hypothetical protein